MNQARLNHFKKKLLAMKTKILSGGILSSNEDLKIDMEDLSDETDYASNVIEQQVSFNIRQKEFQKLREIEDALHRIECGEYGICEECECAISEKRLEVHPYTSLCIVHAEEKERKTARFLRAM